MKCTFQSLDPKSYLSVDLKNNERISVGRGPHTQIKTEKCSRQQVDLVADFTKRIVTVFQIGPNDSYINGQPLRIGASREVGEGDEVHLVLDQIKYRIDFEGYKRPYPFPREKEVPTNISTPEKVESKPLKIPKMFLTAKAAKSGANEFLKDEYKPPSKGFWKGFSGDKLWIYASSYEALDLKQNIAAFDLDGTLITTKSGKVFPRDTYDWKFLYATTVSKVNKFFADRKDFKFVIITNQAGIGHGNTTIESFRGKIEEIIRKFDVPAIAVISIEKDENRKPLEGGWNTLIKEYNGELEPDRGQSLYIGDAAGRKGDHSSADRLFALNLGLTFKTPEEFFMGSKPAHFDLPAFNPKNLISNPPSNDHITYPSIQEMILMIGYPASGKSSYAKKVIVPRGYVYVNRDTLKTQPKCLNLTLDSIREDKSVVIDNTNPDRRSRGEYINLAKKYNIPVRAFKMNVDHQHALHNNKFRSLVNGKSPLADVVFNTFRASYQEPTKTEGFSEIIQVSFVPDFDDATKKELYGKYLLEK